jgi:Pectate lyase superfamily protein
MPITRRQFLGAGVAVGASLALAWHLRGTHSLGVYNVQDYGAVGDGSTDDTAAIDAAITAAGSGATVYFPNGTYMHDTGWTLATADMRLLGAPGSVLKMRTNTSNVSFLNVTADRVTIEGLTINCNETTFTTFDGAAVYVDSGCDDCHIHNCRFVDFRSWGVRATGDPNNVARLAVTDCYFEVDVDGVDANAIIVSENASDFEISGNTMICTGDRSSGAQSYNNVAGAVTERGRFVNNTVYLDSGTSVSTGLGANLYSPGTIYPRQLTFVGNTLVCSTSTFCLMSVQMTDSTIVGNTMLMKGTTAPYGIEVVDSERVTVTGNTIDGAGIIEQLIIFSSSTDCVATDNILNRPGVEAIRVYADNQFKTDSSRNILSDNKITMPGTSTAGGISLIANGTSANIDDTIVAHNHIDGNSNASGIRLELLFGSIARSLVHGNNLRTLANAFVMYGATADSTFTDNVLSGITATQRFVGDPGSATGVSVIDNTWQFANAAPTAEYHFVGERVWKSNPSGSNPMGWICTTAGTPGTWTAMPKRHDR